jgi:hypothetical protein
MPVAGRKSKPPEERRNRHAPTHEWTEVPDVPFVGGPPLPPRWMLDKSEGVKVRTEWPARTKNWWRAVSAMPHCVLWSETDWAFALDVAETHARFIEGTSGAELRIREKILGTTMDARRDLRIRYVKPREEPATVAGVTNLDDYRDL